VINRPTGTLCQECRYKSRTCVVGDGPENTGLMLVGEAPGKHEAKRKHPFVGPSGSEQDNYYLPRAGLSRSRFYVTNLNKCHPPKNEDPKEDALDMCMAWILHEIEVVKPRVIGAVGRLAARFLTGEDIEMEFHHGLHFPAAEYLGLDDCIVVPLYHPAWALRNTGAMDIVARDYEELGEAARGNYKPITTQEPGFYMRADSYDAVMYSLQGCHSVALDTELVNFNEDFWCLSYCGMQTGRLPQAAFQVMADNDGAMQAVRDFVANPEVAAIFHNAPFDLPILEEVGVCPAGRIEDTMSMSYIIQDLPLGLKPLAFRLLRLQMHKYKDVVGVHDSALAQEYLKRVVEEKWPDPWPYWERKSDGSWKRKKPQNIGRKTRTCLTKHEGTDYEFQKWWKTTEGTEVVEERLGRMPIGDLRMVDEKTATDYACEDAYATARLYPILDQKLRNSAQVSPYRRDIGLMPMIVDMHRQGMVVNAERLDELDLHYRTIRFATLQEIEAYAGRYVNPASSKQVRAFLAENRIFVDDTSAETLETVDHPAAKKITKWRQYDKLSGTYVAGLHKHSRRIDGQYKRVNAQFRLTNTATGRISTGEPNLMAMPTRTKDGKLIRSSFEATSGELAWWELIAAGVVVDAPPPGYVFFSADYSQIEMRVAAIEAQDDALLTAFRNGVDVHSDTASKIFHLPIDKLDEMEHRDPSKRAGFGILYGITAVGLLDVLVSSGATGWNKDRCQELISNWYRVHDGIREWQQEIDKFVKKHGYVADRFGRRRQCPEIHSSLKWIRSAGLRQSKNHRIQSAAQGVIKQAMVNLTEFYREIGKDVVRPLLQIHDDLIFEIREDKVLDVAPALIWHMENAVKMELPLKVDPKIGRNWHDMQDLDKWKEAV